MAEPLTSDGRVATRGAVQRRAEELIRHGFNNRAAAEICRVELGGRTTPACIAWYRSHMRKAAGEARGATPEATDGSRAARAWRSRISRALVSFLRRAW
jgi:hypothetical protein